MFESFTAGALRALRRAEARARARSGETVELADLAAALADESESRASAMLSEFGLAPERLLEALGLEIEPPPEGDQDSEAEPVPMAIETRAALGDASSRAKAFDRSQSVGTEHILAGLLAAESEGAVAGRLEQAGLSVEALLRTLADAQEIDSSPISLASEISPLELVEPNQAVDLARILDASANRAREGLRVVEDFVRFALDDPLLTRRIKEVRHRLAEALRGLDPEMLLGSRDTREMSALTS